MPRFETRWEHFFTDSSHLVENLVNGRHLRTATRTFGGKMNLYN